MSMKFERVFWKIFGVGTGMKHAWLHWWYVDNPFILSIITHLVVSANLQCPETPRHSLGVFTTPDHYHHETGVHETDSEAETKDPIRATGFATPSDVYGLASEDECSDDGMDETGLMTPRRARRNADSLLFELRVLDTIRARTELRRQRMLRVAAGRISRKATQ